MLTSDISIVRDLDGLIEADGSVPSCQFKCTRANNCPAQPQCPWSNAYETLLIAEEYKHDGASFLVDFEDAFLQMLEFGDYTADENGPCDPMVADVPIQAQLAVDSFKKFLTEFDYPCEPVEIPYEATTLPGYLCINPSIDGPAPTIIFQEGKDGWAEDGKFMVDEAASRGYNVLLFDGPGIGKVMRTQGLPFRYDWENVITPIVDYLVEKNEVDEDNIALVAVSLGGYLGPRAAAFEPRLKALIANPGVIDWSIVYSDFLDAIDPNLMRLLKADPASFDETISQIMQHSPLMEWGMIDSMWHHNQTTPSELMEEIGRFNNRETAKDITACTLVIDADAETRGQSLELFDSLVNCPKKDYVKFATEEAAQLHVQPGATAILSARMFNWLDEVFDMDLSGADATEAVIKSPATRSTLSASVFAIGSAVVALALAN